MDSDIIIFVTAQIFGAIAMAVSVAAFYCRTKTGIVKGSALSSVFGLVQYVLLGAFSGMATKTLALVRDVLVLNNTKHRALKSTGLVAVMLIAYVVIGVATYQNVFSVLPIMAAVIYLLALWYGDEDHIRLMAALTAALWLIYDIAVLAFMAVLHDILVIVFVLIAYYRRRGKKSARGAQKKQRKTAKRRHS